MWKELEKVFVKDMEELNKIPLIQRNETYVYVVRSTMKEWFWNGTTLEWNEIGENWNVTTSQEGDSISLIGNDDNSTILTINTDGYNNVTGISVGGKDLDVYHDEVYNKDAMHKATLPEYLTNQLDYYFIFNIKDFIENRTPKTIKLYTEGYMYAHYDDDTGNEEWKTKVSSLKGNVGISVSKNNDEYYVQLGYFPYTSSEIIASISNSYVIQIDEDNYALGLQFYLEISNDGGYEMLENTFSIYCSEELILGMYEE